MTERVRGSLVTDGALPSAERGDGANSEHPYEGEGAENKGAAHTAR